MVPERLNLCMAMLLIEDTLQHILLLVIDDTQRMPRSILRISAMITVCRSVRWCSLKLFPTSVPRQQLPRFLRMHSRNLFTLSLIRQAGRQAGRLTDNRRNYVHKDITLHCKLRSSSPTDTVQPWICRRIQWGAAVHIAAVIGPSACTALSAVAAAVVVVDVHRCTRSEDTWRTPSRNGRH